MSIFMILFLVLLLAWILGFGVLHMASALIHILLIVAHSIRPRHGTLDNLADCQFDCDKLSHPLSRP